jgi:hypothetical protein
MLISKKTIWLSWLLATLLSTTLAVTLGTIPIVLLMNDDSPLSTLLALLISGLFIGTGQWIILRTRLQKAGQWILATTIGIPFGIFSGGVTQALILDFHGSIWVSRAIVAVIGGTITAILQCRALHSKLPGSLLWLLATGVSWGIAICLVVLIFDTYLSNLDLWYLFTPLLGMLIGAIVGIITGAFVETGIMQTTPKAS